MSTERTPWRSRKSKISSAWSGLKVVLADQRTFWADGEIEAQERRVGLESLLGRPGEALDDQAPVMCLGFALLFERLADRVLLASRELAHLPLILPRGV